MSRRPDRRRRIFPRFSLDEDVDREIRSHVEQRADELMSAGWEERAARDEAMRLFGDAKAIARECARLARQRDRADRRARVMGSLWQDIGYGMRTLRRSPGFTAVAIVTLGLGIGANSAIFTVINAVLLRSLPYPDADRIVYVTERNNRGGPMSVAWRNFLDWHEESTSFSAIAAYGAGSTTVLGGQRPLAVRVASVTEDFWPIFGVTPLRGRLTVPSDHVSGAEPVVVVSETFWRSELGERDLDDIVLEMSSTRARVVGVVPAGFDFPSGAQVWSVVQPIVNVGSDRTAHNWRVVAHLREGVSVERADQAIDALTQRIVLRQPDADPDFIAVGADVVTLQSRLVGDSKRSLYMLLGAAGLVLLVACTNLASTLLARGSTRAKELALRMALGAGQGRIVRQLLTESFVLAAMGAIVGLALGSALTSALKALGPATVPRLAEVGLDGWVLSYTASLTILTAFLFGLLPALKLRTADRGALAGGGDRGSSARRGLVWSGLVASEVALALVLLAGSGLLLRSFRALLTEDAGFDPSDVTTAEISLSRLKYPAAEDHERWYEEFLTQLQALPGAESAGVISAVPTLGAPNGRLELDGDVSKLAEGLYVVASAGAFQALDIPLMQGRLFDEGDRPDQPHVAIVSRSFADLYWPDEDPIGRSVTGGGMDNFYSERTFAEVVGVVDDVRFEGLSQPPHPTVYFPYTQRPFRLQFGATVLVESATGDPAAVAGGLRTTLQRLDPDVPVSITTLEARVGSSLSQLRFIVLLLGGFALVALLLAGVGIYGVVSYSVAQRTREMGIRLALGAGPGRVLALVMVESLRTLVVGLVLGLLGAQALSVIMGSFLYEVGPRDPVTLTAAVSILAAAGALATWLPARAGTRVDPMIAMRAE